MAHIFTHLVVHALFSTSGRRPILQAELRPIVFPYMAGIIKRLKGQPLSINGPNDHVHPSLVEAHGAFIKRRKGSPLDCRAMNVDAFENFHLKLGTQRRPAASVGTLC